MSARVHATGMTATAAATNPAAVNPSAAPAWLRVNLAAEIAGVTERSIRRWISVGYIRASKPAGGRVLIQRDSLLAFLEQGMRAA